MEKKRGKMKRLVSRADSRGKKKEIHAKNPTVTEDWGKGYWIKMTSGEQETSHILNKGRIRKKRCS